MVEIWDCRRREKIVTRQRGGDYELAILDEKGNVKMQCWFQMRGPYPRTFQRLEDLMKVFKWHLKRQE